MASLATSAWERAGRWLAPSGPHVDDDYRAFTRTKFYPALNGLRGIAILVVIRHHVMNPAERYGFASVMLFFTISGFLLTTLLLRERAAVGEISLGKFYARRMLRTFPIYYAVLLLYVALVVLMERGTRTGREFLGNAPFFLTFTSNWFVSGTPGSTRVIFYFSWSLAIQEQFYLLWPPLVKRWAGWRVPVMTMATIALVATATQGLAPGAMSHTLGTLAPLCFGCIAAYVAERPRGFQALYALAGRKWSLPLLGAASIAAVPLGLSVIPLGIVLTLLVVASCIRRVVPFARPIRAGFLPGVGLIGYGVYLFHMLALNTMRLGLPPAWRATWLEYLCVVAATLVVAKLSYHSYESWFLKLKEHFRPAPPAPRPVAAPAPGVAVGVGAEQAAAR